MPPMDSSSPHPGPADGTSPQPDGTHVCMCSANTPRVPRPRNRFILYRQHRHSIVVQENPGKTNPEISKIIAEQWKALPDKEKEYWIQLGDEEKRQHLERFPDYRYQPRRSYRRSGSTGNAQASSNASVSASTSDHVGQTTFCPVCKGIVIPAVSSPPPSRGAQRARHSGSAGSVSSVSSISSSMSGSISGSMSGPTGSMSGPSSLPGSISGPTANSLPGSLRGSYSGPSGPGPGPGAPGQFLQPMRSFQFVPGQNQSLSSSSPHPNAPNTHLPNQHMTLPHPGPPPPPQASLDSSAYGPHRSSAPGLPLHQPAIVISGSNMPRHQSAPEALSPIPQHRNNSRSSTSSTTSLSSYFENSMSLASTMSSNASVAGGLPRILPRPQDDVLQVPKSPIPRQPSPFKNRAASSPTPESAEPARLHSHEITRHSSPSLTGPWTNQYQQPGSAVTASHLSLPGGPGPAIPTGPMPVTGYHSGPSTPQHHQYPAPLHHHHATTSPPLRSMSPSNFLYKRPIIGRHSSSVSSTSAPHAGPLVALAEEEMAAKRRRTSSHYDPLHTHDIHNQPPSHLHNMASLREESTSRNSDADSFGIREKADYLSTVCDPLHHPHHIVRHSSGSSVSSAGASLARIVAVESEDRELAVAFSKLLHSKLRNAVYGSGYDMMDQLPAFIHGQSAQNMFKISCLHQMVAEVDMTRSSYVVFGGYFLMVADDLVNHEGPIKGDETGHLSIPYRHRWMASVGVLRGLPGPDFLIFIDAKDRQGQSDEIDVQTYILKAGSKFFVVRSDATDPSKRDEFVAKAVDRILELIAEELP